MSAHFLASEGHVDALEPIRYAEWVRRAANRRDAEQAFAPKTMMGHISRNQAEVPRCDHNLSIVKYSHQGQLMLNDRLWSVPAAVELKFDALLPRRQSE